MFREPTLDQDGKITDLLRHLMGDHGEPSGNANGNGGEKRRSQHNAIDEVMERIANQNQVTGGPMCLAVTDHEAMSPNHETF